MTENLQELLRNIPFLSEMSPEEMTELTDVGSFQSIGGEETLFKAGDPGDSLYVILNGMVRVIQELEEGQQVELVRLGAGSYFGEMAIIDGSPRSATVETVDPCEFFLLGRDAFLELLVKSPETLSDTLISLTGKIRQSNEKTFKLVLDNERQRAQGEIERHRSISQMVAGVAHEINTPLGIINQAASLITEYMTPDMIEVLAREDEEVEEMLTDILDAAKLMLSNAARARDLVTTFKNLSVQQVTDTREEVDIGKTVEEVTGLYRFKARSSHLQIEIRDELGDEPENRIWNGFPGYLSQVILNFITNIDRYAYPEGEGGRVEISIGPDDGRKKMPGFKLEVADFGRGIPPEDLPNIFNPFFTTGRNKGGTGLGLAIVYNFVTEALKGEIEVVSATGKGTRFIVHLPQVVGE